MSANQLASQLCGKVPLLQGMSTEQCSKILAIAEECSFAAGEVLLKQGGDEQQLWIVTSGEVEVIRHPEGDGRGEQTLTLATLGQFANFGEMSFFHKAPHSASVRAKSAVKVVRIERCAFDDLLNNHPAVAFKLALNTVQNLAECVRRMDIWVAELLSKTKPKQLDEWNQFREQLFDKWSL